ncbi:barstar family protein [Streptomyces sp. NPDC059639]|uniref:barstar family protein n=1 Tax=Streptomyces sp. NPDC059639 TaxID=3346891 RepID=UPI0036C1B66A
MMSAVHEDEMARGSALYTLTETEHGHAWGVCAEVEGLFGESERGTYELFGWVSQGAGMPAWAGRRVWLVPDDEPLDVWLLEDAERLEQRPGTDRLVLTGLDDYEGPPEGYRGRVRVHDGRRWLGSCREFTRILSAERTPPPLVLRGLAPSERLRAALAKGTRRALDLEEACLEIRDRHGERLTDLILWTTIKAWSPSSRGGDLIDLEFDARGFTPVPEHAQPLWERWLTGPPQTVNTWAGLDTRRRGAWHDLVRERGCRLSHHDRPAAHAYELDGRYITDEPALYLALGEAVNGPGGYFGGCLAALDDCLRGAFGYTAPATLIWRDAETAREHLSRTLTPEGEPYDLFTEVLEALTAGGMTVTLA